LSESPKPGRSIATTRQPFGASAASVGRNSIFVAPSPCSMTIGSPLPALIVATRPAFVLTVSKRSEASSGAPFVAARKPTPRWRFLRTESLPAR
jgi:hypothetical protein